MASKREALSVNPGRSSTTAGKGRTGRVRTSLEAKVDIGRADDETEHGANNDCADGELSVLFGGVGVLWEGVAIIYKGYVTRGIITGSAVRCRPHTRHRSSKVSRRQLGTASPPLDAGKNTSRPQDRGQPWG